LNYIYSINLTFRTYCKYVHGNFYSKCDEWNNKYLKYRNPKLVETLITYILGPAWIYVEISFEELDKNYNFSLMSHTCEKITLYKTIINIFYFLAVVLFEHSEQSQRATVFKNI